jgi:hypothetical protein
MRPYSRLYCIQWFVLPTQYPQTLFLLPLRRKMRSQCFQPKRSTFVHVRKFALWLEFLQVSSFLVSIACHVLASFILIISLQYSSIAAQYWVLPTICPSLRSQASFKAQKKHFSYWCMQTWWLMLLLLKSVAPLFHRFRVMILVCWNSWIFQQMNPVAIPHMMILVAILGLWKQ